MAEAQLQEVASSMTCQADAPFTVPLSGCSLATFCSTEFFQTRAKLQTIATNNDLPLPPTVMQVDHDTWSSVTMLPKRSLGAWRTTLALTAP